MLELLLKQNELDSIYLLKTILYSGTCPLSDLNEKLNKDTVTIKRKISTLNNIFSSLGYDDLLITVNKDYIQLSHYRPLQNILLDTIRFFLIASPIAHVIKALVNEQDVSQEYLLANIHISESYLNKIIKKINDFLLPADVAIVSRKKLYLPTGPHVNWLYLKLHVQYFFNLYNLSLSNAMPRTASQITQQQLIVSTLVDENSPVLLSINEPTKREMRQILTTICATKMPKKLVQLSEDHQLVYLLFMIIFQQQIDTTSHHLTIGKKLVALNYNKSGTYPLITETLTAVHQQIKNLPSFTDDYFEMTYFIFIQQLKKRLKLPTLSQQFKTVASASLTDNDTLNKHSLPTHLFQDATHDEHKTTLTIFIKLTATVTNNVVLKHLIKQTFLTKYLTFVTTTQQADIIISDHLFYCSNKQTDFYLLESFEQVHLNHLLAFIGEKIIPIVTNQFPKKVL